VIEEESIMIRTTRKLKVSAKLNIPYYLQIAFSKDNRSSLQNITTAQASMKA